MEPGARPTRGRLTNARTGNFIEFLFNPTTVSVSAGSNLSKDPIPGADAPLIRWASGKERSIKFTLQLDGGESLRFRGANLTDLFSNGDNQDDPFETLSIRAELAFFDSFSKPARLDLAGSDGGADKVVLNLGSYFDTVVCYLEDAPIKITHWSPTMAPVRAEVSVSLVEVNPVTVFSDEVSNFDYEGYVR